MRQFVNIALDGSSIDDFSKERIAHLFLRYRNEPAQKLEKRIAEIICDHDFSWPWFEKWLDFFIARGFDLSGVGGYMAARTDKKRLREKRTILAGSIIALAYAADREQQLRDGGYPFWILRASDIVAPCPIHDHLDGLVLPCDHPFWQEQKLPVYPWDKCRIVGARSRDMARKLGGDPDKKLPDWVEKPNPKTGTPIP